VRFLILTTLLFTVSEDLGTPGTQNFAGTGVGINNWNWNFGDNATGNVQNPSNVYASMGNYDVKLITTSAGACKDSITKTVNVTNFLTGLENNSSDLTVSPNPAKNTISIINGNNSIEGVEIIDILGKTYCKSNSYNSSIDVSELNNGIYFVKLKTNKEDKIVKIVISK
jgi:PKD repeat protein